jgi:hypothetical protein
MSRFYGIFSFIPATEMNRIERFLGKMRGEFLLCRSATESLEMITGNITDRQPSWKAKKFLAQGT